MDYTQNGRFTIIRQVGSGSFGKVYLATDSQYPSVLMALKVVVYEGALRHGMSKNDLLAEVNYQRNLSPFPDRCNESIVCYVDAFDAPLGDDGRPALVIVSQYINGGSLHDYIESFRVRKQYIPPSDLWIIMRQLVSGLHYIHKSGLAHRDIKPANIMMTSDGNLIYVDLGLMCDNDCSPGPGTPGYSPPEILNGTAKKSLEEAQAHDVWSLGITFYNMCMYTSPGVAVNDKMSSAEMKVAILNYINNLMPKCNYIGAIDTMFNSIVNFIIEWMLTYKVYHRPTISEVDDYMIAESGSCIDSLGNDWGRQQLVDAIINDGELPDSNLRKDILCMSRGFSSGGMM